MANMGKTVSGGAGGGGRARSEHAHYLAAGAVSELWKQGRGSGGRDKEGKCRDTGFG